MARTINLDTPLLTLSAQGDQFTLRDFNQHIIDFGASGSGKTSGSGRTLARALVKSGMGGLVLCTKPEEAEMWFDICRTEGRSQSFVNFDHRTPGYNFLAHELSRHGEAGINATIELVMRVIEIANTFGAAAGRPGDSFWIDTSKQVMRNTIPVLFGATGTVQLGDLLKFVRSAPTSPEQMRDPEWQRRSFFFEMFARAMDRLDDGAGERITSYWENDWARLDTKTRGNIAISLTTAFDRFDHGWLKNSFCGYTNIVPELSFYGAIIIMNMPALTLNEDGIIAQQLFKYAWQRAMLTRNSLSPADRERPVFLYADECQYFVNSYDAEFLSTCRSSRVSTVYLTQSLPSLYARMGGENSRDRVHQLVGNFGTKIFHANGCVETNEWAAKTIGRTVKRRNSFNYSEGTSENYGANMGDGTNSGSNTSSGTSMSWNSGNGSGQSWSMGVTSSAAVRRAATATGGETAATPRTRAKAPSMSA